MNANEQEAPEGTSDTSDPSPSDSDASSSTPADVGTVGDDSLQCLPEPQAADVSGQDPSSPELLPPYLFVDLYAGDDDRLDGGAPNWTALARADGMVGAILKAWDGVAYNDRGWLKQHWAASRDAGGDRIGKTWFRGAYVFLEFAKPGADQADAYLAAVDGAGGWQPGDLLPIIDVELGRAGSPATATRLAVPPHPNQSASKQQIIDCVSACAERLRGQTGRRVMLYGRGALRDLEIDEKMGCDVAWNPSYTAVMVTHGLEAFALNEIVLWQYCGDGTAAIKTLPNEVDGFGACDLSVFISGDQAPTLDLLRSALVG